MMTISDNGNGSGDWWLTGGEEFWNFFSRVEMSLILFAAGIVASLTYIPFET